MLKAMAKAKKAALNRRLRSSGYARTRGGYLPPGVDSDDIDKASKLLKVMKKNKSIKAPPDPKIRIKPLNPDGSVNVGFS